MLPTDRPVIAEPVARRRTSKPFTVKIGSVVHVNGALPRDLPAAEADPRKCRGCAGWVFRRGFQYCDECRRKCCTFCGHADGTHRPKCPAAKTPRICKACGVRPVFMVSASYCRECRAKRCPECRHVGGLHGGWCLYDRRQRWGTRRKGIYRGIVSADDLTRVFVTMRSRAVREARKIVGDAWGEDAVQNAFVYFVAARDELKEVPTLAYVLVAVRHQALKLLEPLMRQRTVSVDPTELENIEAMNYAHEHGRPREAMA